jgi:hypothetical protein
MTIVIPISQFYNRNFPLAIHRDEMGGLRYMLALGTKVSPIRRIHLLIEQSFTVF